MAVQFPAPHRHHGDWFAYPAGSGAVRRWMVLSLLLLGLDQATKTLAQSTLGDREILIGGGWGLTYIVNEGHGLGALALSALARPDGRPTPSRPAQ
jgi:hypothetical protein